MIVATAGHVDHGKTLLVKALTGVDTDRLPEEKLRNLTIDLGFAYLPLDDGTVLGFIDVPGHERFVRNMLCGVAAIDYALLIVAADDGIMPQTREHLAILDLLGVTAGAVVITKTDRVEPARVDDVIEDVTLLIDETGLAEAEFFPVSAMTGEGINGLRDHLGAVAGLTEARARAGHFRLAVDRAFTVVGAGLVVTGTVFSGTVAIGERLLVSPRGDEVRVRGIHAQDRKSGRGVAGDRCALNIVGGALRRDNIGRGDWVLATGAHLPARRIDAAVRVLRDEERPLAHWSPVHVHLASADVTGRVAVLGARSIPPGGSALVQLVLDRPIGALNGDRFVLRDQSAWRTIGGGTVLDVLPPGRGRARPPRLAYLGATANPDHGTALQAAIDTAEGTISLHNFARGRNLEDATAEAVFAGTNMIALGGGPERIGLSVGHWATLGASLKSVLADWHRKNPDAVGPTEANIRSAIEPRLPSAVLALAIPRLEADGVVLREGARLRLPEHRPRMTAQDEALWLRLSAHLEKAGTRPPLVRELAEQTGLELRRVETFLVRAAKLGIVIGATKNRYYPPQALRRLAESAEDTAAEAENGMITAAAFRSHTGIGRNLTIEVLEYFDRVRFTRRRGDSREILRPSEEVFGSGS